MSLLISKHLPLIKVCGFFRHRTEVVVVVLQNILPLKSLFPLKFEIMSQFEITAKYIASHCRAHGEVKVAAVFEHMTPQTIEFVFTSKYYRNKISPLCPSCFGSI